MTPMPTLKRLLGKEEDGWRGTSRVLNPGPDPFGSVLSPDFFSLPNSVGTSRAENRNVTVSVIKTGTDGTPEPLL